MADNLTASDQQLWDLSANSSLRTYLPVRVSSIVFKGGKVDFVAKGGRLDNANIALDSVIISNYSPATGQYARLESFKLLTDYFYSTISDGGPYIFAIEPFKHRLRLAGLVENDQQNTIVKTHHFDYNTTMLPPVHNFGQDKWGYYNGQYTNQTLLEAQQVNDNGGWQPKCIYDRKRNNGRTVRDISPDDAQAGMLQKITYPTGGHTSIFF